MHLEAGLGGDTPHVVGIGDAKVGIEALSSWEKLDLVAKMPLAEATRGVAGITEIVGDGMLGRIESLVTLGKEDAGNGNPRGVAAGEQLGSRRGADRSGVEAGQLHALLGHAVEVGGAVVGRAEGADIAVAHVIDKNDDEVGAVFSENGRHKDQREKEQEA